MTRFIWLAIVDYNFQEVSNRFPVDADAVQFVYHLKHSAKHAVPELFSRADIDINPLFCTLLKTTGKFVINDTTGRDQELKQRLRTINADDDDTFTELEKVEEDMSTADLQLSVSETLLVRMPDVVSNGDISIETQILSNDRQCNVPGHGMYLT
ncbi:hypothetical protein EI94DRAFT_887002 [Lactarius quietus]|nr:hypothetical protein EI94DRAFT_887002 [Lactarius quietus]